jgi:nucleoside 2-deoxyribosyltransferase
MKRIYLAARWSRREEIEGYAAALREIGYEVTARWLTDPQHRMEAAGDAQAFNAELANHDVYDVKNADTLVYFAPGGTRGGSHVEFGMALAQGKRLFWIGDREHVFSWLNQVTVFPSWVEFFAYARGLRDGREDRFPIAAFRP